MAEKKDERTVVKVTIEYSDGTRVDLDTYAVVGFKGDVWHNVLLTPAGLYAKQKMNNMLSNMSNTLIQAIDETE